MGKKDQRSRGRAKRSKSTEKELSPAETEKLDKEIQKCEVNHSNPNDVHRCVERAVDKALKE